MTASRGVRKTDAPAPRTAAEVLAELSVSVQEGPSEREARRRLEEFGPNVLERPVAKRGSRAAVAPGGRPPIQVLLASATLARVPGEVSEALMVLGVLVERYHGFVQECRAGKAIGAPKVLVPRAATAIHAGSRLRFPATIIVVAADKWWREHRDQRRRGTD